MRNAAVLPPREFGAAVACNFDCSIIGATFTQFDGGGIEFRRASDGGLISTLSRAPSQLPLWCGKSLSMASNGLMAAMACGGLYEPLNPDIRVLRPDGGSTVAFEAFRQFVGDTALSGTGNFLATVRCNPDGGDCRAAVFGAALSNITSPVYLSPLLPVADSLYNANVELDESGNVLAVSNPRWFGGLGGVKVYSFSGSTYDLEAEIDGGNIQDELGYGLALSGNGRVLVVTRYRAFSTFVYDRLFDGSLCLSQTLPVASLADSDLSIDRDGRTIGIVGLDGGLQVYRRP